MLANQANVVGATFWFRLYAWIWGAHDSVTLSSYAPMFITNIVALKRSLKTVLAWDAERVLIGHAAKEAIPKDGQAVLRQVLGRLTESGVSEHLMTLSAYFWHQPTFLRDFAIYLVKQR